MNSSTDSQKRVQFTSIDDVILLREVVSINPYEDTTRWALIQQIVNEKCRKLFTVRAIKEHVDLLLKKFIKKDDKKKTMTGIEEPYNEYDHLLQQIRDLIREFSRDSHLNSLKASCSENKNNGYFNKDSVERGKTIRLNLLEKYKKSHENNTEYILEGPMLNPPIAEAAAGSDNIPATLSSPNHIDEFTAADDPGPSKSTPHLVRKKQPVAKALNILTPNKVRAKRLKTSALDFLESRNERDNAIKVKELEIQEKKLQLEERNLQLDERKVKLEELRLTHQMEMDKKRLELDAIKVKMEEANKKKLYEVIDNYQRMTDLLLKKNIL